jgi:hypothetical protein
LLEQVWLAPEDGAFVLTLDGAQGLDRLGMDGEHWLSKRFSAPVKRLAYPCLDWSERRDHLAGKLASALLEHFLSRNWLRRHATERALELTPAGHRSLGSLLQAASDGQSPLFTPRPT